MKIPIRFACMFVFAALFTLGCASRRVQSWQGHENSVHSVGASRLVVQISNVADTDRNRRNEVELFVDGKKIKPNSAYENGKSTYLYELALPSGVHKVHAKYRAKSFWKDKEFKLATHDGNVRLYPDYTTFLTMTLEKKSDGTLTRDKIFFTETPRLMGRGSITQIAETGQAARKRVEAVRATPAQVQMDKREVENIGSISEIQPIVVAPVAPKTLAPQQQVEQVPASEPASSIAQTERSEQVTPIVTLDRPAFAIQSAKHEQASAPASQSFAHENTETTTPIVNLDRTAASSETPQANAAPATVANAVTSHSETASALVGKIALQINTTPANADVIVDDKFLGQSPLVTHVDRGRSHVIQISKKGYAEKIKLLERNEFSNQQVYFLIEKLEKEE